MERIHPAMERLQRLIHRDSHHQHQSASSTAPVDVEKRPAEENGGFGRAHHPPTPPEDVFPESPPPDPAERFTAEEQLRAFRHLLGITSDRSLSQRPGIVPGVGAHGTRAAPNLGIYPRVVQCEKKAKDGYLWYSVLISGALGLQIIVAAALTALGAAGGSHVAVTAFGAINTVIAGFLTFLKGSGLPARLKYYQNEWKKLREYIEQRERDFSRAIHGGGHAPPDGEMIAEVIHIERMYNDTKTDIEVNTPDGYTSISKASHSRGMGPLSQQPQQQQQQQPPPPQQQPPRRQSVAPQGRHPTIPEPVQLSGANFLQRGSGMSDFGGFASKLQGALGQLEKHIPGDRHSWHEGDGSHSNLTKDLEHLLPAGLTEKLKRLSARVEGDAGRASDTAAEAGATAAGVAASGVATAERAVGSAEAAATATKDEVARHTLDVARDLEAHERAVQEARRRVETLAGRLTRDITEGVSGGGHGSNP